MRIRFLYKLGAFFLGCLFCFILHSKAGWSPVLASASVGLIGSFLPVNSNMRAAIYSGSFAGMCSSELVSNYWEIFGISLIGAVIYLYSLKLFQGFGGKLGTIAFVSVALFYLIKGSII
ncbi:MULTISPECIES: hypothetical protein [Halobacteriovorax]|uniref:hypothetical protein n=1 Tax=Halobacteriovorax TaxID=1652133 RepID=UPI000EB62BE0|nr:MULTISPECIES: hypothetical protein [Halobacteriovorax]AYF43943.1 hypothetical protein BALOs_0933 [Halobacteriovorax sp. BALOs_7]